MQYNPGPAGRRPLQDEVTVHIPDEVTVHLPDGPNGAKPPDGVTVLVPGAMLAPAPTPEAGNAGEGPVFVDDGGGRKRLMRLAGMLIALLSIGFIAIIGVALAVRTSPRRSGWATSCRTWCPAPPPWSPRRRRLPRPR